MKSSHTVWRHATATKERRKAQNGHKGMAFTSLSGAGKSTLAHVVEEELHQRGCRTLVLNGDNVRHGLCGKQKFSEEDHKENIRRVVETAKLFVKAGVIVFTAFISPCRHVRAHTQDIFPSGDFLVVFCAGLLKEREVVS